MTPATYDTIKAARDFIERDVLGRGTLSAGAGWPAADRVLDRLNAALLEEDRRRHSEQR